MVTEDITPVGVDPDGPSDFFYPFSGLRLIKVPEELRITRELREAIAETLEDPTLADGGKARTGVGACLWAVGELEAELLALRRELAGGQES
jgi:hypothetical protein